MGAATCAAPVCPSSRCPDGCRRGLQAAGLGGILCAVQQCDPPASRMVRPCTPDDTRIEEGTAREELGKHRKPWRILPPTLQRSGATSAQPQRSTEPIPAVPHHCSPCRALGDIPRAVPPHLLQHRRLLLRQPGARSRSSFPGSRFPESSQGQSLAGLCGRCCCVGGVGPALFAPSTWFLSPHFLEVRGRLSLRPAPPRSSSRSLSLGQLSSRGLGWLCACPILGSVEGPGEAPE